MRKRVHLLNALVVVMICGASMGLSYWIRGSVIPGLGIGTLIAAVITFVIEERHKGKNLDQQ